MVSVCSNGNFDVWLNYNINMKYSIGVEVIIKKSFDETMDESLIGMKGIIIDHKSDEMVGDTEEDPLHVVEFESGKRQSFWYEELQPDEEPFWHYVPEAFDRVYTKKDFIEIAKGNMEYAKILRSLCDWQHPETIVDEDLREGFIKEVNGTYEIQK